MHSWDAAPDKSYFDELFRVSKNQIIWGGNYFPLPPTRCVVVWDKMQPWENFSQVELAWTSFDLPAKLVRISNAGNTGGTCKEAKIHPTQKPVSLYAWVFEKFSRGGVQNSGHSHGQRQQPHCSLSGRPGLLRYGDRLHLLQRCPGAL